MQTKKTLLIFLTLMRFFIMTNFTQDVLNSVSKLVPAEKAFGKATATADKARLDTALKLALAVSRMEETLQFEQTQKTEIKKKFFGNPKIEGEKQTYVLTNDQIKNITKITYNPVVLKCAKMSKDVSSKIAEYRAKLNVDYDDFEIDLIRKDFESSKYYDSLLELE